MSKGPGRIERAIAAILDAEPDNAFTTEDLCDRIYRGVNRIEKKHRVAVLRAATNLMKRRDTMGRAIRGTTCAYFNKLSVQSHAMASLKADPTHNYRKDGRWFDPQRHPKWFRDEMGYKKGMIYQNRARSEADLQAMIAEGGPYHKLVVPGGAWWRHAQQEIAELGAQRSGDTERLERIRDEAKAADQAALAKIMTPVIRCMFCGKDQVAQIFTGNGHAICNECVNRCVSAMNAPKADAGDRPSDDANSSAAVA